MIGSFVSDLMIKLIGSAIVGLSSFIATFEWTGNVALAVACQSLATVAAAFLMNRHKDASVRNTHELSLLDRSHAAQEGLTKLIAALIVSKHAFAGQNEAAMRHLQLRGELLNSAGVEFPAFHPRSFLSLTKTEDRLRAELFGLSPEVIADMQVEIEQLLKPLDPI